MRPFALAVALALISSSSSGSAPAAGGWPAVVDLARDGAATRVIGASPGDALGAGGFAAGDFDGDGATDLAIGSPSAASRRGSVSILFGPGIASRDLSSEPPDVVIVGAFEGSELGRAVAAVDLDADGATELAASTTTGDPRHGALASGGALIFRGGRALRERARIDLAGEVADAALAGASQGDLIGASLATGDFNGDGYLDLAAGAPLLEGLAGQPRAGRIGVLFGGEAPVGVISLADIRIAIVGGMAADDGLGTSLAAGDVTGGLADDLIAGTPNRDGSRTGRQDKSGEAFVLSSVEVAPGARVDLSTRAPTLRLLASDEGDYLGLRVASADVDGDRIADAVASAIDADGPLNRRYPDCGEVYAFAGSRALAPGTALDVFRGAQALTVIGDAPNRFLGIGLAAGDLDADRRAEVLASSPLAPGPNGLAGAVFVVGGQRGTVDLASRSASLTIYGEAPGDELGRALAAVDLDGDGALECVVAAPEAFGGRGAVYVVWGARAAPNAPPALVPVADVVARPGVETRVELSATDPDGDPIRFSVLNRPPRSSFVDRGDGTALLAYVPGRDDPASVVTVRASDGQVVSAGTFRVSVVTASAPVVRSAVYRKGALRIAGEGFAEGALVRINGMEPARPASFKPASGKLVLRGARSELGLLDASGANTVVVIVGGVSSAPFVF